MLHVGGVFGNAFEKSFSVVALFLFTAALLPTLLMARGEAVTADVGNPVLRNTYTALHIISFALLAVHWREVLRVVRQCWPAVLLVTLALVSMVWSIEPDLTLRRSLALLGTTAFGLYLAARYDRRTLLRLLGVALGAAAVLSVVFALALPRYGVEQTIHTGAWRGVYTQKNGLGQAMALSAIVFLLIALDRGRWRGLAWLGVFLSAALVALSTSVTAASVMVACFLLIPLYRALRLHSTIAVPLLIVGVLTASVAGALLLQHAQTVLRLIGRDPTLTGRTVLWTTVLEMIGQRPALGYGYSAFWRGAEGPSGLVWRAVQWETPHSHNGFLDLALALGMVGVATFAVLLVAALVRAIREVRSSPEPSAVWPVLFISFFMLYNVTESALLIQNDYLWLLFVAAACSGAASVRSPVGAESAAPSRGLRLGLRRFNATATYPSPAFPSGSRG